MFITDISRSCNCDESSKKKKKKKSSKKKMQLWWSKTKNNLGTGFMYQPLIPSPSALPSFYSCLNVDHNGAVISAVYLMSSILYLIFWSFLRFVFIWSCRHWLCSSSGWTFILFGLLFFLSNFRTIGSDSWTGFVLGWNPPPTIALRSLACPRSVAMSDADSDLDGRFVTNGLWILEPSSILPRFPVF